MTEQPKGPGSDIQIGPGVYSRLPDVLRKINPSSTFLLYDSALNAEQIALAKECSSYQLAIEAGESCKTPEKLQQLWEFMIENGIDRRSLVIGLGGGTILDLSGFAAATVLRGVRWVAIPTTLLAQVDASVGGKTAINLSAGKNLAGAFHLPVAVQIDPAFLKTLPDRELTAGMGEVVKHGLIGSLKLLSGLEQQGYPKSDKEWTELIVGALKVKSRIVGRDFKEHGLRTVLNLGHTTAHALETLATGENASLLHGEAVAIGLNVELLIATQLAELDPTAHERFRKIAKNLKLPLTPGFKAEPRKVLEIARRDKKNQNNSLVMPLLKEAGREVKILEVPDQTLQEALTTIC